MPRSSAAIKRSLKELKEAGLILQIRWLCTRGACALRPVLGFQRKADDSSTLAVTFNHHRGRYTPASTDTSYPFMDLPPGNTLH